MFAFPKTMRVLNQFEYAHVLKTSKNRAHKTGSVFALQMAESAESAEAAESAESAEAVLKHALLAHAEKAVQNPSPRLGLIFSKKYTRRAVDRNRMKRVARELFRQLAPELKPLDYVVRSTKKMPANAHSARVQKQTIRLQMQQLFKP